MKYDRRVMLDIFFDEIIVISHTTQMLQEAITGGGYPLSRLVNSSMSKSLLIRDIVSDDYGEYRLNGAGLKLYWRWDRDEDTLKVRIGGDQSKQFPFFVAAVMRILDRGHIR